MNRKLPVGSEALDAGIGLPVRRNGVGSKAGAGVVVVVVDGATVGIGIGMVGGDGVVVVGTVGVGTVTTGAGVGGIVAAVVTGAGAGGGAGAIVVGGDVVGGVVGGVFLHFDRPPGRTAVVPGLQGMSARLAARRTERPTSALSGGRTVLSAATVAGPEDQPSMTTVAVVSANAASDPNKIV